MIEGKAPTDQQLAVLAAYVRAGSVKEAGRQLGLAEQTVKNHLGAIYERLGVGGAIEAATALGWIRVPGDRRPCGWIGTCTRVSGHRGHHGGFRGIGQGRETT